MIAVVSQKSKCLYFKPHFLQDKHMIKAGKVKGKHLKTK